MTRHTLTPQLALILCISVFLLTAQRSFALDPQSEAVKAGAVLFGKSGCTFCHGLAGAGTERAPSLRDVSSRRNDEQIRRQIHDGGQMMPPFGEALTEDEIAQLSAFLQAKDAWNLVPPPK
jgi:ubiquinol-cytochrome c reductase cytochrome b subunit